jgi:hypothetical protein
MCKSVLLDFFFEILLLCLTLALGGPCIGFIEMLSMYATIVIVRHEIASIAQIAARLMRDWKGCRLMGAAFLWVSQGTAIGTTRWFMNRTTSS